MQHTTNYNLNVVETTDKVLTSITALGSNATSIDTILAGKQNTISSSNKVSADNVDDTSTTNKFVTSSDITKISNAEATTNKVTSLSSGSTDTQYPSAKCVYDLIGDVETILQTLNSGTGV